MLLLLLSLTSDALVVPNRIHASILQIAPLRRMPPLMAEIDAEPESVDLAEAAGDAAAVGESAPSSDAPWFQRPVEMPSGAESKPEALQRIFISEFGAQAAVLTVAFLAFIAWSSTALNDEFWQTPF